MPNEIYVELTEVYSIQATAVKELEIIFTELLTPSPTPTATPTAPSSENLETTPEATNPNEPLPVLGPIDGNDEDGENSEEEESTGEE